MSPRRPRFHFTPVRNWMNDPNGPIHHDGRWHLFFQYNPQGSDWGNMSWGHAVSDDLVSWTEWPLALRADETEECFSGCVVLDRGDTSGLGGGADALVAVYTSVLPDGRQAQSLAASRDGGLTWARYPGNPVLDRGSAQFRDPKVFWFDFPDGESGWVLVAVEAEGQQVLIYRSANLIEWRLVGEVLGQPVPGLLWECPDLFPLVCAGVTRWVLVVSVNPGGPAGGSATMYCLGDFDGQSFQASGDWRWLDHGHDFYAATSFAEAPAGRRIVIAWMSNWAYAGSVPTAPWRGAMSLPRELSLECRDGQELLVQRVPEEVLAGFGGASRGVRSGLTPALPFVVEVPAAALLIVDVRLGAARAVWVELVAADGTRARLLYDRGQGRLSLDRSASAGSGFDPAFASVSSAEVSPRDGQLRLELYLDHASVEVFADGGAVTMTDQILWPEGTRRVVLGADRGDDVVVDIEWVGLSASTAHG